MEFNREFWNDVTARLNHASRHAGMMSNPTHFHAHTQAQLDKSDRESAVEILRVLEEVLPEVKAEVQRMGLGNEESDDEDRS